MNYAIDYKDAFNARFRFWKDTPGDYYNSVIVYIYKERELWSIDSVRVPEGPLESIFEYVKVLKSLERLLAKGSWPRWEAWVFDERISKFVKEINPQTAYAVGREIEIGGEKRLERFQVFFANSEEHACALYRAFAIGRNIEIETPIQAQISNVEAPTEFLTFSDL